MLTVYRRQLRDCELFGKPRNQGGSRNCRMRCPLWVQGTLGGEYVRKALDLTAWEAASDLVRSCTAMRRGGGGPRGTEWWPHRC